MSDSLDAAVNEAMERFLGVLVRRGASREAIQRAFHRACRRLPQRQGQARQSVSQEMVDLPHVLTLWFGDPLYVDAQGRPIALPLRGTAPSLASLVQRVNHALDPKRMRDCLIGIDAVRQIGSRYLPRTRAVALRGTGAPVHAHNFRRLLGILRTFEHNIELEDKVPARFEFVAENPRFPISARNSFDARLREDAMTFLSGLDSRMLNHERKARPGEPTVRIGVGVYRFEEQVTDASLEPRKKRPGLKRISKRNQRRSR